MGDRFLHQSGAARGGGGVPARARSRLHKTRKKFGPGRLDKQAFRLPIKHCHCLAHGSHPPDVRNRHIHVAHASDSSSSCTIISRSATSTTSSSRRTRTATCRFSTSSSAIRTLKMALHTSGSLMEWLDGAPRRVSRPAGRAGRRRADRDHRRRVLRADPVDDPAPRSRSARSTATPAGSSAAWAPRVRGMWIPERVWEQSMTSDLVAAGIAVHDARRLPLQERRPVGRSTARLLPDRGRRQPAGRLSRQRAAAVHDPFRRAAGDDRLSGPAWPSQHPGAIAVFGDDGEKFGAWPETKKHVYDDGWLARFFDLLVANQSWIKSVTPVGSRSTARRPSARSTCPRAATAR